jgi:PilZ domain-containing protein
MPTDGQRIQKRTPATVALQVSSAKQPFITELTFTENVSLHGVRVVTERAWKPGERVIVKSYHGSIRSLARVIYCYPLAAARYAVGLELRSAVGTWVDVSQPQPPRMEA